MPDEPSSEVCDLCGRPMVIKVGKYGKFLACSGFPECRGTKRQYIIGKELEIRRTLSPSHLYSSAFVVEKQGERDGLPERFVLKGAGWGHGVGLCQIGAAVMGEKGYDYKQILLHYFIDAEITKQY